jgi:hypothetical protein
MTNTNCLENIKCPDCGNEGSFRIAGTAIFIVTDDGTGDHGDVEWDDGSYAECAGCKRHGTLKDFKICNDHHEDGLRPNPTTAELLDALKSLADQADEDCPTEYRSRHFREALQIARDIIAKTKAA